MVGIFTFDVFQLIISGRDSPQQGRRMRWRGWRQGRCIPAQGTGFLFDKSTEILAVDNTMHHFLLQERCGTSKSSPSKHRQWTEHCSAPRHQEEGEDGEGDSDQEEAAPNTAFWVLRVERKYLAERLLQNNTMIIMLSEKEMDSPSRPALG